MLHFVAFFHVVPLFSTRVYNEKALELDNRIFFHNAAWFQYRNITQKCNKTSCCIVAWSRQTFWFELDFLLPKNESVLNILGYFLEQFQIFSQGLQPHEYTLKCSQLISSSDNKKILLTTRNVILDSGHYATKYYYYDGKCCHLHQITKS